MKFKIKYADQIVGFLSIFAIIVLVFIIFLIGSNQKWFVPKHYFYTNISSASSVSEGKGITYKGFEIGKIKSISLDNNDNVVVNFYISDEYKSKITRNSIIEISVAPFGLGTSVIFYPGNSTELMPDGIFVPERSSKEAKDLIAQKKVFIAEQNDSITNIISSATSLLAEINTLLKQVNLAIEGNGDSQLTTTLSELNAILANIANITDEANGLIPRLLEDENSAGTISNMILQLGNTVTDINKITTSLNSDMPGIAVMISQIQTLLTQAQDVMEGLKNNPLIKNGISTKPEKESATPKLREDNF